MNFFLIPTSEVVKAPIWGLILKRLEHVPERSNGKWSLEFIAGMLARGEWQAWVAYDSEEKKDYAFAATRLKQAEGCAKVAEIMIITGDHKEKWSKIGMDQFKKWAKAEGCDSIEVWSRPGWKDFMKGEGYKLTHMMWEMNL